MTDLRATLRRVPSTLRQFLAIQAALTILCFTTELLAHHIGLREPYDFPLLFRHPSFMDFRWYFQHFSTLHTADFFTGPDIIMYPAPLVLAYWFFYSFQPFATPFFLTVILGSALAAAMLAARALVRRGLAPASSALLLGGVYLLSYPLWFEFKQANMEIIVWILISLGIAAAFLERNAAAAACFGIAGAMKFFPLIFLGLLLSRKHYREVLLGLGCAAFVLLGSLWLLGPTIPIAWHGMQADLAIYRGGFMLPLRHDEIGFDHSIFGMIKVGTSLAHRLGLHKLEQSEQSALLSTYLTTAAICGTALYALRVRRLPFANQVLCLTLASILLPPVSFDYTLLHLYAPWLLLAFLVLERTRAGETLSGLRPALLLLAMTLSPLSEFIQRKGRFGGQLRCLLLLAVFALALRYPWPSREPDQPAS